MFFLIYIVLINIFPPGEQVWVDNVEVPARTEGELKQTILLR